MKYSIEEIDEMRELIQEIYNNRSYESFGFGGSYSNLKSTELEDRLRTHMINGTTVKELREDLLKSEKERQQEADEAQKRMELK